MKYLKLRERIGENIFTFLDVIKYFPEEKHQTVKVQLSRFVKKGLLKKIKRELYCFDEKIIDEFILANYLYQPSYISLETALNFYGIIPDITQIVTSVTLTTTKRIHTQFGNFSYTKISPQLFFGFICVSKNEQSEFIKVKSPEATAFFDIARKEKALLDYFYVRKINKTSDLRLNLKELNRDLYRQYVKSYPQWVKNIL